MTIARFFAVLAGIVILASGARAAEVPGCATGIVSSKAGPVCGVFEATASGRQAKAFLGIPYAESTARDGRWKSPVPKAQWASTYAAVQYGAICPQTVHRPPVRPQDGGVPHKFRPGESKTDSPPQSEDCLNLNVWTPAGARPGAKLPVMVFIFGGGFEAGDSADPLYDGAYLAANKNVILVNFNYRLGVLGFLAADGLPGNYGFMDQQLALSWVQENIAAFGGDPAKVTLFGESAGAMSVGLHLFSAPASVPLFRAAIMESNFFALPYKRVEAQVNVGNIFKQGLNCRDVDCLRAADVNAILAGQQAFTAQMSTVFSGSKYYIPFAPVIDGTVLTRQPVDGAAEGAPGKPILMGTNKNEAVIFVEGEAITPADYSAWAASLFGKAFQKVVAKYPARADSSNSDLWARVQTDNFLICSTRHVAVNAKAPVYAYLFNHQPSFKVWGGPACREGDTVCHGDELPFVFHSADRIGGRFTADEVRLSNTMMDQWTNFATQLDPNGVPAKKIGPYWPQFGKQAKDYLALDAALISVQTDPYREACEFWDGIGYALTEPWGPN